MTCPPSVLVLFLSGCVVLTTASVLTSVADFSLHDAVTRKVRQASSCDSKWTDINAEHTMCQEDVGTETALDAADKAAILDRHNELRGQVDPPASNMPTLVWDDELALVAGKWARLCVVGHDSSQARRVPSLPGVHVGQNGAFGYSTFLGGVNAWWNEVEDFKYGNGSINGGVVGHYTQMAAARSVRIGCGQAYCASTTYKRFYFCNYAIGQYTSDTKTPYASGASCSDCPNQCDSEGKRCDCGGLICLNGGTMEVSTCSCTCPSLYTGNMCQTLSCPTADKWFCDQWPQSYCDTYSNVPVDCPYKCVVCPGATDAPSTAAPTNPPTTNPTTTNPPTDAPTSKQCEKRK